MNFEIDKVKIVEENSNGQFATIECDLCRSGMNTHRLPISRDAIRYSANSIMGKPILVSVNESKTDFEGHEVDEVPCGFFLEEEPMVHEKDNELFITAKGKIWKRYFDDVMSIFKDKNGATETSMEIEMLEGEEPTHYKDGRIDLFSFTGLTLLGVAPAIKGSEARVLSFSEIKEEYGKENIESNVLDEFSKERMKDLDVNLECDKSSLYKETEEKAMENEKVPSHVDEVSEPVEVEEVVCEEVIVEEQPIEPIEEKEFVEDEIKVDEKDEEDVEPEQIEEPKDEEKVDGDDEKVEEFEDKKVMSLDVNAYAGAMLRMLEIETKEQRKEALESCEFGEDIIMAKVCEMADELFDLREFKKIVDEEKKMTEIDKVLASVKDDLSEEKYEELKAEGYACDYATIGDFSLKAKAFAYDNKQNKKKSNESSDIIKMGSANIITEPKSDVWSRISSK